MSLSLLSCTHRLEGAAADCEQVRSACSILCSKQHAAVQEGWHASIGFLAAVPAVFTSHADLRSVGGDVAYASVVRTMTTSPGQWLRPREVLSKQLERTELLMLTSPVSLLHCTTFRLAAAAGQAHEGCSCRRLLDWRRRQSSISCRRGVLAHAVGLTA